MSSRKLLNHVQSETVQDYSKHMTTLLLHALRVHTNSTLFTYRALSIKLTRAIGGIQSALSLSGLDDTQEALESWLYDFICELLKDYPLGPGLDVWDGILARWFMLSCRKWDGSFLGAHACSKPVSAMMWCIRVILFQHLELQVEDEALTAREKQLSVMSHCLTQELIPYSLIDEVAQLVSARSLSVAGHLLQSKAYIERISKTEVNIPNHFWRDSPSAKDHDLLSINGKLTSVTNCREVLQHQLDSCEAYLEGLLEGIDQEDTPLDKIHDQLGNHDVGYSAIHDKRNHFGSGNGLDLIHKLVKDKEWASRVLGGSESFVNGIRPDGKDLDWNLEMLDLLNQQIDSVIQLLGTAIHMVYGSPARGTELLTTKLVNSVHGDRSWYILGSRVVSVIRWQKTSVLEGGKDTIIPRVLDERTSQLWIKFIAYLNPLQAFLGSILRWTEDRVDNCCLFFFAQSGVRLNTQGLTRWTKQSGLGDGTTEGSLGVEDWRQLVSFLQDYYNIRLSVDSGEDASISGFGHGSGVHSQWYNRGADWIPQLEIRRVQMAMVMCQRWHRIMGVDGADGEGAYEKALSFPDTEESVTKVQSTPVPFPAPTELGHTIQQAVSAAFEQYRPSALPIANMSSASEVHVEVSPMRLLQLRQLGIPAFRSREQAMVTEQMISNHQDGLYIMPTGSGKTLPYILTAHLLGRSQFIAVIVPFRALLDELRSRCNAVGVTAWEWIESKNGKGKDYSLSGICLVSVERVGSWVNWAKAHTQQLVSIIFFE